MDAGLEVEFKVLGVLAVSEAGLGVYWLRS